MAGNGKTDMDIDTFEDCKSTLALLEGTAKLLDEKLDRLLKKKRLKDKRATKKAQ